ncbi:hypothetical protein RYX36_012320 [Vicia faba]
MSTGLRGPTNLFGHPTDQLLKDLDLELSQWDSLSEKPVTKISFGHFPYSFSAASSSGRTLKDVFLKHSISAYLCGHLHSRFGKNLKRHHHLSNGFLSLPSFLLNHHQYLRLYFFSITISTFAYVSSRRLQRLHLEHHHRLLQCHLEHRQ